MCILNSRLTALAGRAAGRVGLPQSNLTSSTAEVGEKESSELSRTPAPVLGTALTAGRHQGTLLIRHSRSGAKESPIMLLLHLPREMRGRGH